MLAGDGETDRTARVLTADARAVARDVDAATFRAALAELVPAQRIT